MRSVKVAAVAATLLVASCGGADDDLEESANTAGPDLPHCEDVWVLDEKLPEDYQGCLNRAGEGVASTYMNCGGGNGWGDEYLYWYEDGPLLYHAWSADRHDYPVEWLIEDGNEIGKLSGEPVFDTALNNCQGN